MNIKNYSCDFEKALIYALYNVFENIIYIGCFYHYISKITSKTKELKITDNNNDNDSIVNKLYKAPFIIQKNQNYINEIFYNVKESDAKLFDFKIFFNLQWKNFFDNGILNYYGLSKNERSNSYLENYNCRTKLKLSYYLYGKNKCRISWPLFLYFILHEEDGYRREIMKINKI